MNKKEIRHRSECFNKFVIKNNFAIMYVESKKYGIKEVIIDIDKIPLLSQTFWHICKQYDNYFIAVGWIKNLQKEVKLHRFLTNCPQNLIVDHINRNPLDNRLENLRCVSQSENMLNKKTQTNSTIGYKGIRYRKDCKKFQARIMVNKKAVSIGHFNTLLEAVIARQQFCQNNNIIA